MDSRVELMVMTLELDDDGNTDTLRLFDGDDPLLVAQEFGKKHGLDQDVISALYENIQQNLAQTIQQIESITESARSQWDEKLQYSQEKNKRGMEFKQKPLPSEIVVSGSEFATGRGSSGQRSGMSDKNSMSQEIQDEINMNEFRYRRQDSKPTEVSEIHREFKPPSPYIRKEEESQFSSNQKTAKFASKTAEDHADTPDKDGYLESQKHLQVESIIQKRKQLSSRSGKIYKMQKKENEAVDYQPKAFFFQKQLEEKLARNNQQNSRFRYFTHQHATRVVDVDNVVPLSPSPSQESSNHTRRKLQASETRTDTIRISDHLTSPSYVYNTLNSHQSRDKHQTFGQQDSDSSTERKKPVLQTNGGYSNLKRKSQSNIHDRLYTEAWVRKNRKSEKSFVSLEKQKSELQKSMVGIHVEEKNPNKITNRLYYQGLQKQELKQRQLKMMKYVTELQEEGELTFTPQISQVSNLIAANQAVRYERPIEDYLISEGQRKHIRMKRLSGKFNQLQHEEFTHVPEINPISRQIVDERKKENGLDHRDYFEHLYEESFLRKFKMEQLKDHNRNMEQSHNFKPQLNPTSRLIMESKQGSVGFYERMQKFAIEKLQKQRMAQLDDSVYIQGDRKKLDFMPKTGRAPQQRNIHNLDVGTYLYEKSIQNSHLRQKEQSRVVKSQSQISNIKKSNEISDYIIETKKQDKFSEIFKKLDTDDDGLVSAGKISIERIDEKILMLIAPVLIEMEDFGLELDFGQFCEALDKLFRGLSVEERNQFLFGEKKGRDKGFDKDLTFKPKINKNTDQLIKQKSSRSSRLGSVSLSHQSKLNNVGPQGAQFKTRGSKEEPKFSDLSRVATGGQLFNPIMSELQKIKDKHTLESIYREEEPLDIMKLTFQPKITPYSTKNSHYV